jgi:uncharacterized membrane protein YccF (DUF307 family)
MRKSVPEGALFFLYLVHPNTSAMNFLGNLIWLLFGGLATAIGYFCGGLAMMVTIIGIPFGFQLIKIGSLCLWPFGRTFQVDKRDMPGCLYSLLNVIWLLIAGLWIALLHIVFGFLLSITIIGIPWGMQHFKLAGFALSPFGRRVDIVG